MKRFMMLALLSVSLVCYGSKVFAQDVKNPIDVTVYALEYPPYSYEENGIVKGIYTDILQKVFIRMEDYRITIKAVPWKRGISYLEDGTGFAAYPPSYRPKDRPFISPYSIPISDEKVVVFCREDILKDKSRPNWPDDYYGLKIGNNAGYVYGGDKFWSAVKEGKIKIEETTHTDGNLQKLALKRIDCYMNERVAVLLSLKKLTKEGKYDPGRGDSKIVEGPIISEEKAYLAYTNRDNGRFRFKEDFVKKFDTLLSELIQSGEVQKIFESYLK